MIRWQGVFASADESKMFELTASYTYISIKSVAVVLVQSINALSDDVKCKQFCTYYNEPFCAAPDGDKTSRDKLTFTNKCVLEVFNCRRKTSKFYLVIPALCRLVQ